MYTPISGIVVSLSSAKMLPSIADKRSVYSLAFWFISRTYLNTKQIVVVTVPLGRTNMYDPGGVRFTT